MTSERQEIEALAAKLMEAASPPENRLTIRSGSFGQLAEWLLARGVRMPGSPDSIPNWPLECLDMIREDLEAFGMDMKGCPPMMYNDALRNLVSTLGLKLGFTTSQEIAALMRAARPPREAAP